MKKAKRILAAVVSCALALSCSVSVLAETEETENTADSGYISVIPDTSTSGSSLYTAEEETTGTASETAESATEAVTETEAEETDGSVGSVSIFSLLASADTAEVGAFSVTGDTDGYSYSTAVKENNNGTSYTNNVLTISGGGEYLIAMADGVTGTSTDRIVVNSSSDVIITLDNINISTGNKGTIPFQINASSNIALILKGENYLSVTSTATLAGGYNSASALSKNSSGSYSNSTLTITSIDGDGSTSGSLYAYSGSFYGAGIGSNGNCSNITINGGTITATGGNYGAGIGGGQNGSGSNITINGGVVTATGGTDGAGIGGGYGGIGSDITINDGVITTTGGSNGAGIGGGCYGTASSITINGGTVTATGGNYGAGIGGGKGRSGSNITISGGTVEASGKQGAGIGGGYGSIGSDITINDGVITASSNNGAGIGGGQSASGSDITINDGVITASSDTGASIGGGYGGDGSNISINNGYILLTDTLINNDPVYIGGGEGGTTETIIITGGYFGLGEIGDGSLSITKTVDKAVARPGDTLTYEITVSGSSAGGNTVYKVEPADSYVVTSNTDAETNSTYPYAVVSGTSGGSFSDIYVVDELPSGLTFVSASDDGDYSDVDNKVTWIIDTLNSGDSKTLTLVTTVD